jgi:hypothetical protein
MENDSYEKVEEYSGGEIQEFVGKKPPKFLYFVYAIVFIIGILWFYWFWNGSSGVLDPGYWKELEEAANTRYPYCSSGK